MRKLVLLATVAAFFVSAGSAQGFVWHLKLSVAQHETKMIERELCAESSTCVGYGVGRCERITESRVDCIGANLNETSSGEIECQSIFHWGVRRGGELKVRITRPHCFYVE
ncbi:MAG TPA: hypothetical protein VFX35_04855 [Solirubrobacterales bacterium]|nr:hypothetical protein [Solirubrobacterales bacterium]